MPPASVGNISATNVGRVKDGPANCVKEKSGLERAKDTINNGKKEKMVVVGTVEDLSTKAKADAAELSGEKAEADAAGLSGARAEGNTLRASGEKT